MKYIVGIKTDLEKRMDEFAAKVYSSDEDGLEVIVRELGFDENTDIDKLTLLDVIPAFGKIMLGLPIEFWTKPLAEMTKEDEAMYDEIMDQCYTFFESTKK